MCILQCVCTRMFICHPAKPAALRTHDKFVALHCFYRCMSPLFPLVHCFYYCIFAPCPPLHCFYQCTSSLFPLLHYFFIAYLQWFLHFNFALLLFSFFALCKTMHFCSVFFDHCLCAFLNCCNLCGLWGFLFLLVRNVSFFPILHSPFHWTIIYFFCTTSLNVFPLNQVFSDCTFYHQSDRPLYFLPPSHSCWCHEQELHCFYPPENSVFCTSLASNLTLCFVISASILVFAFIKRLLCSGKQY